ncbi:MAG: hypothetical protein ACT4OI_10860 [Methanobacteriota archaeon]
MSLQASRDRILREALALRPNETFERSLGRAVRRNGGDYADYLAIVTEIREFGRPRKLKLEDAARALAGQ